MATKKRRRSRIWIPLSILAVILLGAAGFFYMRNKVPASYESVQAEIGDLTTYYTFSGNVETKNRQTVLAEKIMQISEIDVSEGQAVKEEDLLMKSTVGDKINAKINGEVSSINVQEDQQVMAGTKLMELVDYNNLEINAKVDEYAANIKAGQDATVLLSANNKEYKGKISKVSKEGQITNGVTYFTATIDLPKDSSIRIGMSADVKLISNQAKGIVTLPMSAIQFDDNNKPYVLKTGTNNKTMEKIPVTTGINDGTSVEIKDGLTAGETVFYPKTTAVGNTGLFRGKNTSNQSTSGGSSNDRNS